MRIIRFIDEDGQTRLGNRRTDGSVEILLDAVGTLGPAQEQQATRQSLGGKRALVADDDLGIRQTVAGTLDRFGCQSVAAEDGQQAIDALRSQPFDLVVSDIVMPHHDGYEVFAAAKQHDERTPVVLITGFGYDAAHTLVRCTKRGLEGVLFKPFTPKQLVAKLSAAMWNAAPAGSLVPTGESAQVECTLAPLDPRDLIGIDDPARWPADLRPAVRPGLFMKPGGCAQDPGKPIRVRRIAGEYPTIDCRGQIAIVIGRAARSVCVSEALKHVLGFTLATDAVESTPLQNDKPWLGPGCFDTSCPIGPQIVTPDDLIAKHPDATITTRINGVISRSGTIRNLAAVVAELVSRVSALAPLRPGSVLLMGPPAQSADQSSDLRARPGDQIAVECEGIGRLANPIEGA